MVGDVRQVLARVLYEHFKEPGDLYYFEEWQDVVDAQLAALAEAGLLVAATHGGAAMTARAGLCWARLSGRRV